MVGFSRQVRREKMSGKNTIDTVKCVNLGMEPISKVFKE